VTNIEFDDDTIEEFAEEIHRLDLGNIFDCAVFRPRDASRTTTTANITLWNRARHDELIERLNRRLYRGTVLHCRGSHTPGRLDDPIFTAYRVPCPSDAPGDPYAYREPQHGDYTAHIQEHARRLLLHRSRRAAAVLFLF
jgi:hypothetical protein